MTDVEAKVALAGLVSKGLAAGNPVDGYVRSNAGTAVIRNPELVAKAARYAPFVMRRRDGSYSVPGSSGTYIVTPHDGRLWCSCPARSAALCSHRLAVIFHLQQQCSKSEKDDS